MGNLQPYVGLRKCSSSLLLILLSFSPLGIVGPKVEVPIKSLYRTAYFDPIPGADQNVWRPIFEDLLNSKVGTKLNISFEAVPAGYEGTPTIESLLREGSIDFVYTWPVLSECFSAIFQTAPLLTLIGMDGSLLHGGVIIARNDRSDINSLEDVKGKTIASMDFTSLLSYQLQKQTLQRAGIHILSDSHQIRMYRNVQDIMSDVVNGGADIGLVPSESLAGEPVKVLYRTMPFSPFGEYEYPVSTSLVPSSAFSSVYGTHPTVTNEVVQALLSLDADHPTAQQVQSRGFTFALPYTMVRNAMLEANTLRMREGQWRCFKNIGMLYDYLTCPDDRTLKTEREVDLGCSLQGYSCPQGATCLCGPCKPAPNTTVLLYMTSIDGQATMQKCSKMKSCGGAEQMQEIEFLIVDYEKAPNQTFTYSLLESGNDADKISGVAELASFMPDATHYRFKISSRRIGTRILEIEKRDTVIDVSPTIIDVRYRTCLGNQRVADEEGNCKCADSTFQISESCVEQTGLILSIVIPVVFCCGMIPLFHLYKRLHSSETSHLIRRELIKFEDRPEILGSGPNGEVLKASFRNMDVAAKRIHWTHSKTNVFPEFSELVKPGRNSGNDFAERDNTTVYSSNSKSHVTVEVTSFTLQPLQWDSNMEMEPSGSQPGDHSDQPPFLRRLSSTGSNSSARSSWADFGVKDCSETGNAYLDSQLSRKGLMENIKLMSKLHHPSITTVMGSVIDKSGIFVIMELMKYGSLQDLYLNEAIKFDGELVHPILQDIVSGMIFLHAQEPSVVHGNLRATNVLVGERFRAKITDFLLRDERGAKQNLKWMAPELLMGEPATIKSDVYSFGIVISEVMARKPPFDNEFRESVLCAVADPHQDKYPELPGHCPDEIRNLFQRLLQYESSKRPSFSEIKAQLDTLDPACYKVRWSLKGIVENVEDRSRVADVFFSMFPRHIAEALVRGEKPREDRSECSTVFFSDIVGFTELSSHISSFEVSKLLDRLFRKFDQIAEDCAVCKLETIGDCYIGVTNLAESQPEDHVARIASFSLRVLEAAANTLVDEDDPSKGFVNIRSQTESSYKRRAHSEAVTLA